MCRPPATAHTLLWVRRAAARRPEAHGLRPGRVQKRRLDLTFDGAADPGGDFRCPIAITFVNPAILPIRSQPAHKRRVLPDKQILELTSFDLLDETPCGTRGGFGRRDRIDRGFSRREPQLPEDLGLDPVSVGEGPVPAIDARAPQPRHRKVPFR